MKKEEYKIIVNNLTTRIENCKKYLDKVLSTEDLSNLSIKEFLALKSFCKQEQIDMTEICMVDLYHILGMGELSTRQTRNFLNLLKEYTTYRSDMKCICSITDIESLPKLPTYSKYTLHKLGSITLQSKGRGTSEAVIIDDDMTSIEDYRKAKRDDVSIKLKFDSIMLEGNILTLNTNEADKLVPIICGTAKLENLLKACESKLTYCDIVWEYANEEKTKIKGVITSSSKRNAVRDRLKNKGIIL